MSRTRMAVAAVTFAALAITAGVWLTSRSSEGGALVPANSNTEAGANKAAVGEIWHFGTGPIAVKPGHRVQLDRAEVRGLPSGLEVVAIRLRSSNDPGGPVGALPDNLFRNRRHEFTTPPSPLIVGGQQQPYWEFIVSLRITRPGQFKTAGVRVRYHESEKRGYQDFPYAFYMNTA